MPRVPTAILMFLVFVPCAQAGEELIQNGDFEQGRAGWGKFWSRTGDGQAEITSTTVHGGQQAAHIQYPGTKDWSFPQAAPLAGPTGRHLRTLRLAADTAVRGKSR